MWERIDAGLKQPLQGMHPAVRERCRRSPATWRAGRVAASVAARRLLDLIKYDG
jgi:LAO/AO transport system kinase